MAKDAQRKVRFCNVSVPSILFAVLSEDLPKQEADVVLAFIELATEGIKVSFSYQEERRSYTVAITLPRVYDGFDLETASFWDNNLYDALCAAYIATFLYKAQKIGFDASQEAMKTAEKRIAADVKASGMSF